MPAEPEISQRTFFSERGNVMVPVGSMLAAMIVSRLCGQQSERSGAYLRAKKLGYISVLSAKG